MAGRPVGDGSTLVERRGRARRNAIPSTWLALLSGAPLLFAQLALGQVPYPASVPGAPPAVYADPRAAADRLESILRSDSLDYGANWRAAHALVALAAMSAASGLRSERDSLSEVATRYARRAVALEPDRAEGHFALAAALGRASLTASLRDRLRFAKDIESASKRAIELDSLHDGAWHVLGRWHVEIRRVSGIQRFVAVRLLGGDVLDQASWEEGIRALERAVALRPDWIHHRLDLALAYTDRERYAEARAQLAALERVTPLDWEDPEHLREAARLSQRIAGKP
jgi:tetratricopeptide (TPR) repeat protein